MPFDFLAAHRYRLVRAFVILCVSLRASEN